MKDFIGGTDTVEAIIGRWFPGDLAFIKGLELKNSSSYRGMDLIVDALFQRRSDCWPDTSKKMYPVKMSFFDISDLSLKGFGGSAVQVMGFDIHSIGAHGRERINFEIEDYEDGRIKFYCNGITVHCYEPGHLKGTG